MVQYVVDKSSSSSTSCLTDSLYQEVTDQEVSAWLERECIAGKPSQIHVVTDRNTSFGYILLASLQCTLI